MNKDLKKFLRNLILCILINEILQGRLTVEEAHVLIDAASDSQRIEREKRKREKQIREMNERFISVANRHGRNNIFERFRQGNIRDLRNVVD